MALSFLASGETDNPLRHFELFAECKPMDLFVEGLPSAAAESRPQAARLFSPESKQTLYININVLSAAFSISM